MAVVFGLRWRRSSPISSREHPCWSRLVANVWRLCFMMHRRHYASSRTMRHRSAHGGAGPVKTGPPGAQGLPLCGIVRRPWSEALEESQQIVIGLITDWFPLNGLGLGQDLLFQGKVGVQIDLGSFHRLMPQPERDHGAIYTSLQELHCGTVPKHVRRNAFVLQCGASLSR